VIGTEIDTAVFGELEVKPVKQLELDGAGRYDHYQHFGGAATPQVGAKWTPIKYVALRGTWGKGFRAPSAAEGQQSGELFGAGSYTDPVLCAHPSPGGGLVGPGDFPSQCGFPLEGFQTPNPNLHNVKSTNWTTGIILQPIDPVSVSMDYYNIKINNDIISGFEAGGFAAGYGTLLRGAPLTLPYCPPSNTSGCTSAQLVPATTPIGTILAASFPYINAGSTHTTGWDLDLKAHYDAGRYGIFAAEATWTHLLTYQLTVAGVTYELAGTHGPSGISGDTGNPKDRAQLTASWTKGPLTISPSLNYVGHFSITDPSSGIGTCAAALGYEGQFLNGVTPANQNFCSVGYFLETNVYASYQLSDKFQVHASVTNLFDKQPPVDMQTYGAGTYFYRYDAAFEQDGAVGRFITIGASYQF
jgi:iron complex outermembrane recepter protein